MPKFITKFSDEIRVQTELMQDRLKFLKAEATSDAAEAQDSVRKYIDKLDVQIGRDRKRLHQARDEVEEWAEERVETLNEWRSERHVEKLVDRADRADRYAKACMDISISALDKAERAMLQASLARADAKSAQEDKAV